RQAQADGLPIKAQVAARPVGLLYGLDLSLHPFRFHPSYMEIHHLPLAERVAEMRRPERRRAILSEKPEHSNPLYITLTSDYGLAFALGAVPVYEPAPGAMLNEMAQARGTTIAELAYDSLLEQEGNAILLNPASNVAEGNLDA